MFENRIVTFHLSDIIFLFIDGILVSFIIQIYPYDHSFALYLLIPTIIMSLAYIWKFIVTSVKKEESVKSSLKVKIPAKRFFEA